MKTLYFLNQGSVLNEAQFLPIKPEQTLWVTEKSPSRLTRRYHFDDYGQLAFFVSRLLTYANKISHYPELEIGYDTVLVSTYTHSLQAITAQDTRMVKMSDQIYDDATYVKPDAGEDDTEQEEDVNNDERLAEGYRFDWTADW